MYRTFDIISKIGHCLGGIVLFIIKLPFKILEFIFIDNEIPEESTVALNFANQHNIPPPTKQHCPECGSLLISKIVDYRRHYFGNYDSKGNEWFIIKARYFCPNDKGHFIEAGGRAVYWTDWGKDYHKWAWETPFTLTNM